MNARIGVGLFLVAILAAACAPPGEEEVEGAEDALAQSSGSTVLDQVALCEGAIRENKAPGSAGKTQWPAGDRPQAELSECERKLAKMSPDDKAARERTLAQCLVSWREDPASARTGVSPNGGFGQEYSEYHALARGVTANALSKSRTTEPLRCVFTNILSDAKSKKTPSFTTGLVSALATELEVEPSSIEPRVVTMQQSDNSRASFDGIVSECSRLGRSGSDKLRKDVERQVLCLRASKKSGRDQFARCKGVDLSDDAAFEKAGLEESPLTEEEKSIAGCAMLHHTESGLRWRQSEQAICAAAYRASRECNVTFRGLGAEEGLAFGGVTKEDLLPVGCKALAGEGVPSRQIVVCTPNPQQVRQAELEKKSFQSFCDEAFGRSLRVYAPLPALANTSKATEKGAFCSAFVRAAKAEGAK